MILWANPNFSLEIIAFFLIQTTIFSLWNFHYGLIPFFSVNFLKNFFLDENPNSLDRYRLEGMRFISFQKAKWQIEWLIFSLSSNKDQVSFSSNVLERILLHKISFKSPIWKLFNRASRLHQKFFTDIKSENRFDLFKNFQLHPCQSSSSDKSFQRVPF